MDTIKTAIVVILLLAVLYIVYVVLNKSEAPLPDDMAWDHDQAMAPLQVEMGSNPYATGESMPPAVPQFDSFDAAPAFAGNAAATSQASSPAMALPTAGAHESASPQLPPVQPAPGSFTQAPPNDFAIAEAPDLIAAEEADEPREFATADGESVDGESGSSYAAMAAAAMTAGDASASASGAADTSADASSEVEMQDATTASAYDVSPAARGGDFGGAAEDMVPADAPREFAADSSAIDSPSPTTGSVGDRPKTRLIDSAVQTAKDQMGQGQLYEALLTLSYAYNDPEITPAEREELHALVDPLAGRVIYSQEHLMEPAYEVQAGDTLPAIAEQYSVPWQLLANINGITDPQSLQPGQQLKVVRGPFHADIDLASSELTLFVRRLYAGRFQIQVGDNVPPPADYSVQDKQPGQTFYAGDARTLAADDPRNPFGGIWIDLGGNVCIHSRPQEATGANFGCISLAPRDANDIYGILSRGSSVVIRR